MTTITILDELCLETHSVHFALHVFLQRKEKKPLTKNYSSQSFLCFVLVVVLETALYLLQ